MIDICERANKSTVYFTAQANAILVEVAAVMRIASCDAASSSSAYRSSSINRPDIFISVTSDIISCINMMMQHTKKDEEKQYHTSIEQQQHQLQRTSSSFTLLKIYKCLEHIIKISITYTKSVQHLKNAQQGLKLIQSDDKSSNLFLSINQFEKHILTAIHAMVQSCKLRRRDDNDTVQIIFLTKLCDAFIKAQHNDVELSHLLLIVKGKIISI